MNMYLIIMDNNYGTIDASDYICHGYYMVQNWKYENLY